ncbi:hypothetical protein P7K49_038332 [Saguinus oedipus]|uniref:Uncharacterized protein n=1 Tax=Saguinus oedipus TaxID=9490 RepID=A0ABQ9TED7_SAGOE|nr:hypothetical protein P7K49_038332 [Saguinus oedipus]
MSANQQEIPPPSSLGQLHHLLTCQRLTKVLRDSYSGGLYPGHHYSAQHFSQMISKNKEPSEVDDTEDKCENMITIENGIPCDPLDMKGGHINDAFMTEDERLTPL